MNDRDRAGHHSEAIAACAESRRINGANSYGVVDAVNHAIEAIAHHHLKNSEQAAASLAAAEQTFEENLPTPESGLIGAAWHDRLTARIRCDEAKQLISEQ